MAGLLVHLVEPVCLVHFRVTMYLLSSNDDALNSGLCHTAEYNTSRTPLSAFREIRFLTGFIKIASGINTVTFSFGNEATGFSSL